MLRSWRDWQLPHVRWICLGVYFAVGIVALVLGAGPASALIAAVVGTAVVGVLELWFRRRQRVRPADE
jgi:Flp pilus assembly protein TadB